MTTTPNKTEPAADAAAMATSLTTVSVEVAAFDKIGAGLAELRIKHPLDVVADPATPAGMAILKAGYEAYRRPRIDLEKRRQEAKAPVNKLGKDIDGFAGVLKAQLEEGENHYWQQIDNYKQEQARIEAEKKRIDDERKARHQKAIDTICSYAQKAAGLPSARIQAGIDMLEKMRFGAEWEEFAALAVVAQTETLTALRALKDAAVKAEAEAAERERVRVENERVAAALKEQQAAMAAKEAEMRALQEAMNAQKEAMEKQAAQLQAQRDALVAKPTPLEVVLPDDVAAARQVLTDRLAGAVTVGQQFRVIAESLPNPSAVLEVIDRGDGGRHGIGGSMIAGLSAGLSAGQRSAPPEEATLKLGEINAILGPGFSMTSAFVADTLKIIRPAPPAGANGVLFYPSQRNAILEALAERALACRN